MFGGGSSSYLGDLWRFNIATHIWIQIPPSPAPTWPTARELPSMVLMYNGEIWMFGGSNGTNSLGDLWVLHLQLQSWSQIALSGSWPSARYGHAMVAMSNSGWMFGGYGSLNDLWQLRNTGPASTYFTWQHIPTPAPSTPSGRAYHAMVAVGSQLYVTGGTADSTTPLPGMWMLNTSLPTPVWTALSAGNGTTNTATNRFGHAMAVVGGNLLVYGGTLDNFNVLRDLWQYSLSSNTWWGLSSATGSTYSMGTASCFNSTTWWLFGGQSSAGTLDNALWRDPPSLLGVVVVSGSLPPVRWASVMVCVVPTLTTSPSAAPTYQPSLRPTTAAPTDQPSRQPTTSPTRNGPSSFPTSPPTTAPTSPPPPAVPTQMTVTFSVNITTNISNPTTTSNILRIAIANATHIDPSAVSVAIPDPRSGVVIVTVTTTSSSTGPSAIDIANLVRIETATPTSPLNLHVATQGVFIVPGSWSLLSVIEKALLSVLPAWAVAVFGVLIVVVLILAYYLSRYRWPKGHHFPILYILLSLFNFALALFFISFLYSQNALRAYFLTAVICLCLSFLACEVCVILILRASHIEHWSKQHKLTLALGVFLGGFNPGSTRVISSFAFHLESLRAPIPERFKLMLYTCGLLTILFDLPALVLQILVILHYRSLERSTILSLITTSLTIAFSVTRRLFAARRVKRILADREAGIEVTY